MFKLSETSKKIEDDLGKQHEFEMGLLEEEIREMNLANIKYSSELLNKFHKLRFLVKAKNYAKARELQEDIRRQEEKEVDRAEKRLNQRILKMREKKRKKHSDEYNFIKARLEKSINTKLKQRMVEYEKLLLRIQNCHNDMTTRQSIEFGKIQSIHSKLLLKYSLSLDNLSENNDLFDYPMNETIQEEVEGDIQSAEPTPREEMLIERVSDHEVQETFEQAQGNSLGVLQEKNVNIMAPNMPTNMHVVKEEMEEQSKQSRHRSTLNRSGTEGEKENMGFNSQGQINGYWNRQIIADLKPNTLSEMKDSIQLELSNDPEPMLSNFHQIQTEHLSDGKSESGHSSDESESSGSDSSSSSESESDSDSDSDSD